VITVTIATFVILLILGVPVAFAVGIAGFLGLWWSGAYPLAIIIQQIFLTADSFVLLAIPLFVLAGALMETGGIAVPRLGNNPGLAANIADNVYLAIGIQAIRIGTSVRICGDFAVNLASVYRAAAEAV
jgi:TRAP-type mannitol/chloroaromatic compound transport system permease large subunit